MNQNFQSNLVDIIAKRVDNLRCGHGLSIRELAKKSNVAPSTVYNLIQQNEIPNVLTLNSICDALNINLVTLLIPDEAQFATTAKEAFLLKIYRELSPMSQDTLIKVSKCMK